ncbi:MAG: molecular chaperone HtpG [Lentisphaeria bacterium]|nr:molecular chaperone HtpG [Lentisphaeria bacterium]
MAQVKEFKTEVRQLLNLMIHSLYSNRDIFLRELVANAADAIDKARFESLTTPELAQEWQIRLEVDKENKTLTICDNGIGMTEEEVVENIGTIAKSGTKAFIQMLEARKDQENIPELIGQFGVGFYSAFMVANEVELRTKKAGSDAPAVCWKSKGEGEYELDTVEKTTPGTEIKLKLKEDAELYMESWKISEIIHRYSDFIEYPIVMPEVKTNEDKTETVTDRVLNSQKAIWLRKASEITDDEYKSFYGHISNYGGEYLKAIHMSAEGVSEFKALLFLPKQAPFNLLMPDIQKKGLQLYVRRVFITDECKELIPDYLRFVNGVVDSSDLPLNVSREILQENPHLDKIRNAVTGKILSELKKLKENDRDTYAAFFKEFGKVLKEGIHTDFTNAEKIKDLVLYETMNTEAGKQISLEEYVNAMPEEQKEIYYISGEKREAVEASPALEYFRSKGYDVLFMIDPIDEWLMQSMFQYRKKNFKSITKGDFEVEGSADALKEAQEKFAGLVEFLKNTLGDKVSEVRFSARLTESPCCLITEGNALSPHMERLFKAMHQEIPVSKRILELNAKHPLVEAFAAVYSKDEKQPELAAYANVLYDQALLTEGSPLPDPAAFAKQVSELLLNAMAERRPR